MKLILGLGNPGRQYERTRHNVGWWVVEHLADVWHLGEWREKGQAREVSGRVGNVQVRLMEPLTYMNLSGKVLIPYLRRPPTCWSSSMTSRSPWGATACARRGARGVTTG